MFYQRICLYHKTSYRTNWEKRVEMRYRGARSIWEAEEEDDNSPSISSSR